MEFMGTKLLWVNMGLKKERHGFQETFGTMETQVLLEFPVVRVVEVAEAEITFKSGGFDELGLKS